MELSHKTITNYPIEYPYFNEQNGQIELNTLPWVDGVTYFHERVSRETILHHRKFTTVYWHKGSAYPTILNYDEATFLTNHPLNKLSDIPRFKNHNFKHNEN